MFASVVERWNYEGTHRVVIGCFMREQEAVAFAKGKSTQGRDGWAERVELSNENVMESPTVLPACQEYKGRIFVKLKVSGAPGVTQYVTARAASGDCSVTTWLAKHWRAGYLAEPCKAK